MNSQIKTCQSLRYSWGLDDVAAEASLWIIDVVLVFVDFLWMGSNIDARISGRAASFFR
jgi:hypothetical protein